MAQARQAIEEGRFETFRRNLLVTWKAGLDA
jgi:queuine/archaeosine tRNA-ribosyltransferase